MGLGSSRIGHTTLVLTRKSRNGYYNRWLGAGVAAPATEDELDEAIDRARAHRAQVLAVSVGGAAEPSSLVEWLEARGFRAKHPSAKLWRDGSPLRRFPAPEGISVRKVGRKDAAAWVDVVSQVWRSFGSRRAWFEERAVTPGWQHFIAWCGDQPVGAGALFTGEVGTGEVGDIRAGHLVDGVTLKPFRRRGIQAAIIRRRVSTALRLGCTVLTSETAPPLPRMPLVSYRNLRRQGFSLAYVRASWRLDLR